MMKYHNIIKTLTNLKVFYAAPDIVTDKKVPLPWALLIAMASASYPSLPSFSTVGLISQIWTKRIYYFKPQSG